MASRIPHTFTIIFILIVIIAIATWIIPSGQYDRKYDPTTSRELVINGTYKHADPNPQGIISVLTAFTNGFMAAADVIGYILIVGGAYGVVMRTKAIDAGLNAIIKKLGHKTRVLIPVLMFMFAVGGGATGFWEETLPFYLIVIPLIIAAGYDGMVGVAILLLGAGTGVMASVINPFSVGIASAIAEVNLSEGMMQRIIFWFVSVTLSILYVLWYASRVKDNPKKSIIYHQREEHNNHFAEISDPSMNSLHFDAKYKLIVFAFIVMIVSMIYCIIVLEWSFPKITMLFLIMAIFSAVVMRFTETQFWEYFIEGAKEMLFAALVIGAARAIVIIAQEGLIIDTILYNAVAFLQEFSATGFIILNGLVQIGIAFLVPSSSAHAALTMPIMTPLSDLMGVSREASVTAMVIASGIANLITPTSGVLMAALGMARISWIHWVKFIIPILLIQYGVSIVVLIMSL